MRPKEPQISGLGLGWETGDILRVGLPVGRAPTAILGVAKSTRAQEDRLLWDQAGFQPPLFLPLVVY